MLYLSHYFKLNRIEYYEHLQRVRDKGDWESWLKFLLRGVHEVAEEATNTARKIVQLREQHRNVIAANFARSSGHAFQLLEYLYERPILTVNGAAKITGLNYANANNLIIKFQEYGLLRQMDKFQRNRRFVYSEYLAMFSDEEIPKIEAEDSLEAEEGKTQFEN